MAALDRFRSEDTDCLASLGTVFVLFLGRRIGSKMLKPAFVKIGKVVSARYCVRVFRVGAPHVLYGIALPVRNIGLDNENALCTCLPSTH